MKHQVKHQTPITKPQGNSKSQTSKKHRAFRYSRSSDAVMLLNEVSNGNGSVKHPFDLEERTAQFGEAIVRFSKKIPRDPTNNRLIDQLGEIDILSVFGATHVNVAADELNVLRAAHCEIGIDRRTIIFRIIQSNVRAVKIEKKLRDFES